MLYRIHIEQRFDKQKAVIEAVKELTSDFVILAGMAYSGNNHRPCQIIEINDADSLTTIVSFDLRQCVNKLKKILNVPLILTTTVSATQVLY